MFRALTGAYLIVMVSVFILLTDLVLFQRPPSIQHSDLKIGICEKIPIGKRPSKCSQKHESINAHERIGQKTFFNTMDLSGTFGGTFI